MMQHRNPQLFTPLSLRSVTLKNRIAIAPMCQYSAQDGMVNDWHVAHLGRFAIGGAGLVMVEATAVDPQGRITHGDLGLWNDEQIPGLRRIAQFITSQGAVAAIQLAHAGRKASMQRPWHGNSPLDETDFARGEMSWEVVGPSALSVGDGWLVPRALEKADLDQLKEAWCAATRRAIRAEFDVVELHCAHGYLLHEFLSPLTNQRTDEYGGSLEDRCRFPLEVAQAVREVWPKDKPMFVRVSAVDGVEGGWTLEDTVYFAKQLKARGIDVIDCSSGGISGSATAVRVRRYPGFQVPFAKTVRDEADICTMAVGLVLEPEQAEDIIGSECADIVAIGREAMFNPNWPLHAEQRLRSEPVFDAWPQQAGWWLQLRARALARLTQKEMRFIDPVPVALAEKKIR